MTAIKLLTGESAHNNAPKAPLANGEYCVPQHYLSYQHTINTVEELILKIAYSKRYPIFVSHNNGDIYLQIGIISTDNYSCEDQNQKIVYGRKWRVEPNLPSSEIIQTIFLAIKKAREHEVRELFRLEIMNKSDVNKTTVTRNKVTTPFNNHHDTPMLVNSHLRKDCIDEVISWPDLQIELDAIRYDHASFYIQNIEQRQAHYWLIELEIIPTASTQLAELLKGKLIVLVIEKLTLNEVLHQLMSQLISLSDNQVNENFTYEDVARFSKKKAVKAIASISANTRLLHKAPEQAEFAQHWQTCNYETDLSRVPQLKPSLLVNQIKAQLAYFAPLSGVLPRY
jgi:hypothetical protein